MSAANYAINLVLSGVLIVGAYQFYFGCQRDAPFAAREVGSSVDDLIPYAPGWAWIYSFLYYPANGTQGDRAMRNPTSRRLPGAIAWLGFTVALIASSIAVHATVPLRNVAAITAGSGHTCALSASGGVKCWGNYVSTPIDVPGLTSGVAAITAGNNHTCALTTSGGVKCWGDDVNGHPSATPVNVMGLTKGIAAISAGYWHTCALTTGGGVRCWGSDNRYGQFGGSSATVDVTGLASGVTAISAGFFHTCALTSAGGVKCWGLVGNQPSPTPVDLPGLTSGVAAIAAGFYHTCALTTAGGVKCWEGQPEGAVDIPGLAGGVAAIAIGDGHTCALTASGAVKCWGDNHYGQLGDLSTRSRLTPVDVFGLTSGVAAIATGFFHTCAVTAGGGVKCWGDNEAGQLGDSSNTRPRLTPVEAFGLASGIASVSAGGADTCALTMAGGVKCWGDNHFGQVGDNSGIDSLTPDDVFGLGSGIAAIATGGGHACALTTWGGVKCWGNDFFGELGVDPGNLFSDSFIGQRYTPVDVEDLSSGVAAIAAGGDYTCALVDDGGVECWGYQTGEGHSYTISSTPARVPHLSAVAAIAAGGAHTCALGTGGGVECWGDNSSGQLGDNSTTGTFAPVHVLGLTSGVAAITAGEGHTCALTSGGGVKCWGDGSAGQLGGNSIARSLTAVDVVGLPSGIVAVAAGGDHTCALTTGGGVKCWGDNTSGQLGDNSTTNRLTPVDVLGLTSGVAAIAAGSDHTCALTWGDGVKCWGATSVGQLGDGSGPWRVFPVEVQMAVNTPGALSGLWWNAGESGWGIHFTQRAGNIFAAWYTYDTSGNPKWYVSTCAMAGGTANTTGTCGGTLYEVNGPAFFGTAFNPSLVNVVVAGHLQVAYQDANTASMTYVGVAGQTRTVAITRQVFAAGPTPGADYTDIWWNPMESGWGMAITQQASTMFLAWYVYDGAGNPIWYVATCTLSGATCSGNLLRTTGPGFGPAFDPSQVRSYVVGAVGVTFIDGDNATLSYTVNGVSGRKAITRQLF